MTTKYGEISCAGELSCFASTIEVQRNSTLRCNSHRACADTTIYLHSSLFDAACYFYGHLSGQNAVVYSMDGNMRVTFSGTVAGDGARVICQSGHNCHITCAVSGCNNTTLICQNCSSIYVECFYAEKSAICPNGMFAKD